MEDRCARVRIPEGAYLLELWHCAPDWVAEREIQLDPMGTPRRMSFAPRGEFTGYSLREIRDAHAGSEVEELPLSVFLEAWSRGEDLGVPVSGSNRIPVGFVVLMLGLGIAVVGLIVWYGLAVFG
jgi:hypothetical protein